MFAVELLFLSNQYEQNQFSRFHTADLELINCEISEEGDLCYIDVSIRNNSSIHAEIPYARITANHRKKYYLDTVFCGNCKETDFQSNAPVIPPGQTASYRYEIKNFAFYREDLYAAASLSLSFADPSVTDLPDVELTFE